MKDPRFQQLAEVLVGHSCRLEAGEKVLIEAWDIPREFVGTLIREVDRAGALPIVQLRSNRVHRDLLSVASAEQMQLIGEIESRTMSEVQAYIGLRGNPNIAELSDVPAERMVLYQQHWWVPVHRDIRVPRTKWVVLRWPDPSMAQLADMSTEGFEDFYFDVCTADYGLMAKAMQPLIERLNQTDRVRVVGPGTDLSFSIAGIPAVGCAGENNIPDGEVFTAPVRTSVEGRVQFNTPTIYRGASHDRVRLDLKEGRIVSATSSNPEALASTLDVDEGARYLGEFAIAFHPAIRQPMRDILFDEKIAGSLHLTPGSCYDDASNGNKSQVHWDLVLRQTPDVGGGEIWFDDSLVRKDGRFVVSDLEGLNPERLGA